MTAPVTRTEIEIFADLGELTASPGYVHAIAFICHRDNLIVFRKELKPDDMTPLFSNERLMRSEISTLLGLMVRHPLDLSVPTTETLQDLVSRTDRLMAELHDALSIPMFTAAISQAASGSGSEVVWDGMSMREPIFYGSESAYSFQYRDLLPDKYGADDAWLVSNKGFSISQAQLTARTMCTLMDENVHEAFAKGRTPIVVPESLIDAFEFSAQEIAAVSGLDLPVVEAVFQALTLTNDNRQFQSIGDFNAVAATPLLPTNRGSVLLFQHYAIYEALYESPFFWMWADKAYRPTAMDHRGAFAEQYSALRLAAVFGPHNVHTNVNLFRNQDKNIAGEADVLVIFGDRLIIVQAKAKKLTLEARKGNDGQLKSDFAAAIQRSYEQGWECANVIMEEGCRLEDDHGKEVTLAYPIKEIYLFSIVSEHYPALAFQASQYLTYQTTEVIKPPFVMDVFLLDAITEMLASPLRFLSYIRLRLAVVNRIHLSHELTALGFHLKQNMWIDDDVHYVSIDDSYAVDLDTAMTVRREGHPGERTPKGILTKMSGTLYERMIFQIESQTNPAALELGFQLLKLNEESSTTVHRGLEAIARRTRNDGKAHDFTLGLRGGNGICFHANAEPSSAAMQRLQSHCHKRKYVERSDTWFGVSIDPNCNIQFSVTLDFPWTESNDMNELTAGMQEALPVTSLPALLRKTNGQKTGRNEACPCQSGKKFKKCCMP